MLAHPGQNHVNVIGISGDSLQIKLFRGPVGLIPTHAAE